MKYNDKWGEPQGNELVYGHDIIRRLDTFEFNLIERFKSSREAHFAYNEWMKENKWNYAKPVVGWGNGPVAIDSWGNK